MESTASFGYWLRRRRRALDLTQAALADQVACAVVTIRKIEADELRPSRQVAERLANCLAIPEEERLAFIQTARAERSPARLPLPTQPVSASLVPPGAGLPPSPYRGLAAFREEDAPFFFGREAFTERLVQAISHEPLVTLVGASGSGKSSVLYAGLVPRLRHDGTWLLATMRPSASPFHALAAVLVSLLDPGLSEIDRLVETGKLAAALQTGQLELPDVAQRAIQKIPGAVRLLLAVDQFEELFTLCHDLEVRPLFQDTLLQGAGPGSALGVVLTLRADFFGYALSSRRFADALQQGTIILGPMNGAELQAAVEQPASRLGVAFEEGLVNRIIDAVSTQPGSLPLLQFALSLLWSHARQRGLTHAAYDAIGGVEQALAGYAEQVYAEFTDQEQRAIRRILLQLARPGVDTADTRRTATRSEVGEENWPLISDLATTRLVVTEQDEATGGETVELVHEALITGWGRLRGWIDADRAFRTWQEELRLALHSWERSGHDVGALLRGAPLGEADRWFQERGTELSAEERRFIVAGLEARDAQERRRGRAVRAALAAAVFFVLLALAGAIGWWQAAEGRHRAEEQRLLALSRQLSSVAQTVAQDDPELSLLLALEAHRTAPTTQAAEALRNAILYPLRTVMRGHTARVNTVAVSPDGLRVITASRDGTARVWERTTGTPISELQGHVREVTSAAFSPDGRLVATAGSDGAARVWEAHSGRLLTQLRGTRVAVLGPAFSPDGTLLVTTGDTSARVWEVGSGRSVAQLRGHRGVVTSAVFSPDGSSIVTASDDATARVWHANSGARIAELRGHTREVTSAAFSPDGSLVVTASADGTARIWGFPTGRLTTELRAHLAPLTGAAFDPDGKRVATASRDGTARVWDVGTGRSVLDLHGHGSSITGVAFDNSGRFILTASDDSTARVWDAATGHAVAELRGHRGAVASAVFAPNTKLVITGGDDGTARTWELAMGAPLARLRGHGNWVNTAVFSPDGKLVVTASDDGTASLWDPASGRRLAELRGHEGLVTSAVFSPDGSAIATSSDDSTARIWQPATGQNLAVLRGHAAWVNTVRFSPNGQLLLTAGDDGTARVWEVSSGRGVATLKASGQRVTSAAFSPDGNLIATASADGTARVWRTSDGQPLTELRGHLRAVASVEFSPNSRRLVTASNDGTARVWEGGTGHSVAQLVGHTQELTSAVFSPDGSLIVTASNDGTARVWDAARGRPLAELRGHAAPVTVAAFNPSGELVVTASEDSTARLWEAGTGRSLAELRGHLRLLTHATFSPDGRLILTASADKTAQIYSCDVCGAVDELAALGRARLLRELTPEEHDRYVYGQERR